MSHVLHRVLLGMGFEKLARRDRLARIGLVVPFVEHKNAARAQPGVQAFQNDPCRFIKVGITIDEGKRKTGVLVEELGKGFFDIALVDRDVVLQAIERDERFQLGEIAGMAVASESAALNCVRPSKLSKEWTVFEPCGSKMRNSFVMNIRLAPFQEPNSAMCPGMWPTLRSRSEIAMKRARLPTPQYNGQ
jgi:hypothetical protein